MIHGFGVQRYGFFPCTISGVDLLAATEITCFLGGIWSWSRSSLQMWSLGCLPVISRPLFKRRLYFFLCFLPLGGDGFLGWWTKIPLLTWDMLQIVAKQKRGIVMMLWLNSHDCCTSTGSNHGSYPSVNLKVLLKIPDETTIQKSHPFLWEKYFA